jgi:hypothetical protein
MIDTLTTKEWNELVHLKDTISFNPFSVVPEKQELFTELLVKSLSGKGEYEKYTDPTNY